MKLFRIGITLFTILIASHMKAAHEQVRFNFHLINTGANRNSPSNWAPGNFKGCPGNKYVCAISVLRDDVYTKSEATALGQPDWTGLPKVTVGGTLDIMIINAEASVSDPFIDKSGRSMEKTQ